ncbi:MAG: antibiotic biosynthesis monooxygenase [Planctomycetaceae bacterium]|nr:antibiotic biosynthesis monooxygenase [Planctomycetaceae bacterium]
MNLPAPLYGTPYFAVVFTSLRTADDPEGYATMAARMVELASQQPGFLGVESARGDERLGITVSYWQSLEAIKAWRDEAEHRLAQAGGRSKWYQQYRLRVCRVERETLFERGP